MRQGRVQALSLEIKRKSITEIRSLAVLFGNLGTVLELHA